MPYGEVVYIGAPGDRFTQGKRYPLQGRDSEAYCVLDDANLLRWIPRDRFRPVTHIAAIHEAITRAGNVLYEAYYRAVEALPHEADWVCKTTYPMDGKTFMETWFGPEGEFPRPPGCPYVRLWIDGTTIRVDTAA